MWRVVGEFLPHWQKGMNEPKPARQRTSPSFEDLTGPFVPMPDPATQADSGSDHP
jgi:hypothetical protein